MKKWQIIPDYNSFEAARELTKKWGVDPRDCVVDFTRIHEELTRLYVDRSGEYKLPTDEEIEEAREASWKRYMEAIKRPIDA